MRPQLLLVFQHDGDQIKKETEGDTGKERMLPRTVWNFPSKHQADNTS